jgi:hypothetical protein
VIELQRVSGHFDIKSEVLAVRAEFMACQRIARTEWMQKERWKREFSNKIFLGKIRYATLSGL